MKEYIIRNKSSGPSKMQFTYCSGIIPNNGLVDLTLEKDYQHAFKFADDYPLTECMNARLLNGTWKDAGLGPLLVMGIGSHTNPPGLYDIIDTLQLIHNDTVIVPHGKKVSVIVTFDAAMPHVLEVIRNGQSINKFSNKTTGNGRWEQLNNTGADWTIEFRHSFEREYCATQLGPICFSKGKEWVSGKRKTLVSAMNHLVIGYDDYDDGFPPFPGPSDEDYNDTLVDVKVE